MNGGAVGQGQGGPVEVPVSPVRTPYRRDGRVFSGILRGRAYVVGSASCRSPGAAVGTFNARLDNQVNPNAIKMLVVGIRDGPGGGGSLDEV